MRVTYALWLALAVIGCSRVDSNRTTTLDDHTKPSPTTGDVAHPESNAPDSAAPVPATTAPSGTGSSTAGTSLDRDTTASGEASARDKPAPNNTAVNQRDRDPAAKTPINQDENQPDVNKTAEIRQRIVNAENMSINARNVKIITSKGKVTLRGPVNSAAEREAIVRFAREVAGEGNVDDQLDVNADSTNPTPSPSPQP
jgi:hypothetical protein